MKFSDSTRAIQLEHRIKLLQVHEQQNWNLIRKAKRELAAIQERHKNEASDC